jgi:hypothetical protein
MVRSPGIQGESNDLIKPLDFALFQGEFHMAEIHISNCAAVVAAIVGMTIGAFWYSPIGFGKVWMRLTGIEEPKGALRAFVVGLITMIMMSYSLAVCVDVFGAETLASGALVGGFIWLGFVATVTLGLVVWEGRRFSLYLINAGYYLVAFAVMGAIHAVFV